MIQKRHHTGTSASTHTEIHTSKWGFHTLSYEDFILLKALHKLTWEAWRESHRYARWARKEAHNRGPAPKLPHDFFLSWHASWRCMSLLHFHKNEAGERQSTRPTKIYIDGQTGAFANFNDMGSKIVEAFREARMPFAQAEDVPKPTLSSAKIRTLYKELLG